MFVLFIQWCLANNIHAEAAIHAAALSLAVSLGYVGYDKLERPRGKTLIRDVFESVKKKLDAPVAYILADMTNNGSGTFKVKATCGAEFKPCVRFACELTGIDHDIDQIKYLFPRKRRIGDKCVDKYWGNHHLDIASSFAVMCLKFFLMVLLLAFFAVPNLVLVISLLIDALTFYVIWHYVHYFPTLEPGCEQLLSKFQSWMEQRFTSFKDLVDQTKLD